MSADIAALLYLVAGVLFILALRGLSSPETSRRGNYMGMVGMGIAVLTTLAVARPDSLLTWALIVGGIAAGGAAGAIIARRIPMTAMPELVAAFHSLVGMAAVLVAAAAFYAPESAAGLRYDDPAFKIAWPLPAAEISEKDRGWPDFVREGNRAIRQ